MKNKTLSVRVILPVVMSVSIVVLSTWYDVIFLSILFLF